MPGDPLGVAAEDGIMAADAAGAEATIVAGPAVTAVRRGGLAPGPGTGDPAPGQTPGTTGGPETEATPGAGGGQAPRVAVGAVKKLKNVYHLNINGWPILHQPHS